MSDKKNILEERKLNLKEYRGYKSVDLMKTLSAFLLCHGNICLGKGILIDIDIEEDRAKFRDNFTKYFFLYPFEKDEMDLILSFIENKHGVSLSLSGNQAINPLEFRDFAIAVFDKILNELEIYVSIYEGNFKYLKYGYDEALNMVEKLYGDNFKLEEFLNLALKRAEPKLDTKKK